MEYLQDLTASVTKTKKTKSLLFGFVLFLHMEFFFLKLINIEEENKKKKEIVILCCSTIFQLVFSYNLYFLKVEKNFKSEIKKKKTKEKAGAF